LFSTEGWLVENSLTYRYWLAFRKIRNPEYRSELTNMNMLIDEHGFQIRENDHIIFQVQKDVKFPKFNLVEKDRQAFQRILALNSETTKVIVIEMPVHPDFLPVYVQNGESGYEELFIQPIQKLLNEKKIPFIRTQSDIHKVVSLDGWIDYAHLNDKGAGQFSKWLADKLRN
jgi:hypothetical protein